MSVSIIEEQFRMVRGIPQFNKHIQLQRVDIEVDRDASTSVTGALIHVTKAIQDNISAEETGVGW